MWNDFHSFGEMFMDLKNFANSLGHNFTGNYRVFWGIKILDDLFLCSLGHKFVGKSNPRNPGSIDPQQKQ